jgi:2,3-diketo-5-methylthio-1-phosphopentane phosphatase
VRQDDLPQEVLAGPVEPDGRLGGRLFVPSAPVLELQAEGVEASRQRQGSAHVHPFTAGRVPHSVTKLGKHLLAVQDSLDTVFDHLAPPDWRAIGGAVRATGGTRASIPVEVGLCRATRSDFERVVREKVALRPGFRELLTLCRERNWEFTILSEGFGLHIRTVLQREGLGGLRFYSNDLVFVDGRIEVKQHDLNPDCGRCGNCKRSYVRGYKAAGCRVVYIGDGITDFCPAKEADLVLAKGVLARYCEREGVGYAPFQDFHDVVDLLRQEAGGGAEE